MCGLCGVLSQEVTDEQLEVFQHLMCLSTLRGPWGAGLVAVNKRGPISILRDPNLTAAELAYSNAFFDLQAHKKKYVCLMGHARFPTSGGWTEEDCHPFETGNLIGMHNGTLSVVNGREVKKGELDSKMLYEDLAVESIKTVLPNSTGSFALSFIDKEAKTLTLVRNEERPLFLARTADGAVYWASELDALSVVLRRRRKYKDTKISYAKTKPDVVMVFRLHNVGTPGIFQHYTLPPPPSHPQGNAEDYKRYQTFGPSVLTKEELVEALHEGCTNCREAATFVDYCQNKIHFCSSKEFMCHECLSIDPMAQAIYLNHVPELPNNIQKLAMN